MGERRFLRKLPRARRCIPRSGRGIQTSPAHRISARRALHCEHRCRAEAKVHFSELFRSLGEARTTPLRTRAAGKKRKTERRSQLPIANQMSLAPWECSPLPTQWRWRVQAAVSVAVLRVRLQRQWSESFDLSKSSSKGRTMVFRLPSATSSSSKTGSETRYFSLAQLPRSRSLHRSLQKGKSTWTAESVSALQIGHLCFMACFSSLCILRFQWSLRH